MINIDELRIKQAEFEGTRQEFKKELEKLENERKQFLKKFTEEKIGLMSIEEYVIGGEKSENSFCYWIENRLQGLGNIHGATAFKFGIYFGKTKSEFDLKYRFTSKFGTTETEAFNNVKSSILQLLESAKKEDLNEIRENPLSPMFKGKILSTYFPNKYLNIFADEHLEYFLDKLQVPYSESIDEIAKRQLLIEIKDKDSIMSKWMIYEFSKFLYESFGRPPKKDDAPSELKEYIESKKDYPKINEIKAEFVKLNIHPEIIEYKQKEARSIRKTIDFEKENKIHKLLGNRGEEIVYNLEKEHLKSIGKTELSGKVKWVSNKDDPDDSLGYDILSFEENGEEKHIEVKSTNQSPDYNANFFISNNQYLKAKKKDNYYFYIVFNAKSKQPKVWPIKDPLRYENKGLVLTPVSYRVIIYTSRFSK